MKLANDADDAVSTPTPGGWRWQGGDSCLPEAFYAPACPATAPAPRWVAFNPGLAEALGLDAELLSGPTGAAWLSGAEAVPGATPVALSYAGHQFGGFTMLGDGRAILLGDHVTPTGERVEVQLKGAGPTPYARGGDGRAALGPMLREHLIGEAMHALGIPTTRSLGVVATGTPVRRETVLPGAVLTRIAASHLRVGTFEFAARFVGHNGLRDLAEVTIARHFPDLQKSDQPYRALWQSIAQRQADLVAAWMGVGFVHGVMNTDNVALSGQTLDYGPCAFIDNYDPAAVFSSIDRFGRYAFGQQPTITQWNLARLAEAMLPLLGDTPDAALAWAQDAVSRFAETFEMAWLSVMRPKLGLLDASEDDGLLIRDLLDAMRSARADYTLTFRSLCDQPLGADAAKEAHPDAFSHPELSDWLGRWTQRLADAATPEAAARDAMRAANPAYIPRNHRVEAALSAAVDDGDLRPYRRLLAVLARPFDDQPDAEDLRHPASPDTPPYRTFCGT